MKPTLELLAVHTGTSIENSAHLMKVEGISHTHALLPFKLAERYEELLLDHHLFVVTVEIRPKEIVIVSLHPVAPDQLAYGWMRLAWENMNDIMELGERHGFYRTTAGIPQYDTGRRMWTWAMEDGATDGLVEFEASAITTAWVYGLMKFQVPRLSGARQLVKPADEMRWIDERPDGNWRNTNEHPEGGLLKRIAEFERTHPRDAS